MRIKWDKILIYSVAKEYLVTIDKHIFPRQIYITQYTINLVCWSIRDHFDLFPIF